MAHKNIVEMELNAFKDSMWRLTNRVYILETFIKEKFGDVLVCVDDGAIKENTSVIKQWSTLRRKAKTGSPVNSKNKRAKRIPNSVDRGEEVGHGNEESISGTDDDLLNCDVPVKESTSLTAKVRSPKRKASRKSSPRNLANTVSNDILKSESTKVERNVVENATPEIEIKEEYVYLSDDSNGAEGEGEELQSGNDPAFIVNQNFSDSDPSHAGLVPVSQDALVRKSPNTLNALSTKYSHTDPNTNRTAKTNKNTNLPKNVKRENQVWTETTISEDLLAKCWGRYHKHNYKNSFVEYFFCAMGGRRCPAQVKCTTVLNYKQYYVNQKQHIHVRNTFGYGLTLEQKSIISELLKENTEISPTTIVHIFKSRNVEIPEKRKLSNFLRHRRKNAIAKEMRPPSHSDEKRDSGFAPKKRQLPCPTNGK